MTGTVFLDGRYRLIEPIGAGGMSVVWRGYDDVLARPVAIKLLAGSPTGGPRVDMIRHEAMAIARITHPCIANVFDYGESPDSSGSVVPYIVMELVEGSSLANVLARGPLSWPTAAGIGAQVAAALAAAHQYGVVHRDVTPSNIMLCADGVKMVDFGISAPAGQAADPLILGTPAYLAPERLGRGVTEPATDVYGLGLVLYQMISGHLPWPSETTTQMLTAHQYVPPAPLPTVAGMPPHLADLCRRALAVDPAARPSSAQLAVELATIARVGDPRSRPSPVRTAVLPPSAPAIAARSWPAAAMQPRREAFVLPALLLAMLLIGLAVASLHQSDQAVAQPAPTVTPRTAAPPTPACTVGYRSLAQWVLGFEVQVKIVNSGTTAIDDWTLRFDLPAGQRVSGGWNGRWQQAGTSVTVRNAGYDADIPAGGSVMIGFVGTEQQDTSAVPAGFTLNGTACAQQ